MTTACPLLLSLIIHSGQRALLSSIFVILYEVEMTTKEKNFAVREKRHELVALSFRTLQAIKLE